MQLKIGFVNSTRELVLDLDKEETNQADVLKQLEGFLANKDGSAVTTVVEDARGSKVLLVRDQIAYAQVGSEKPRSVGFI